MSAFRVTRGASDGDLDVLFVWETVRDHVPIKNPYMVDEQNDQIETR